MDIAVTTDRIGKQYCLGELHRASSLRETISNVGRSLIARRRRHPKQTLWALQDISIEVKRGEVVGIIGRNGSGKSTLLKVLSRITYPTCGDMSIQGRVASLLEVGTGFHDELTGRENIYLNGSILGMKKREIDARMDQIVEFADVTRFLDTPVKRYSSGMRLRLGFAVAAHLEPDVMLVDEVLAVGDAGFQKKCLGAMSNLHAGGRTVLFVSHNLAAVEHLCPRTLWVDSGRIRRDGDSAQVIKEYLETFADAQGGGSDLTHVDSRKGSGELRCTRLEFLDGSGAPLAMARTGEPLTFRLHYNVFKRVMEPHFGIEIYNNLGALITSLNTWTTGFNLESLSPGPGHIEVRLPCVFLNPDRYYISIWAASAGPKYYDQLELCMALDVEAADVHGSGRALSKHFGAVYLPCEWSHCHREPVDRDPVLVDTPDTLSSARLPSPS
jgi:lipopolysaccharide transport system ATP-binding protein